MQKISTPRLIVCFKKLILLSVFVSASVCLQAYAPSETGGVQAKVIKCYPNPAISFINIEFPLEYISKNYSLNVFSFTGKKVYQTPVTSAKITLTFTNEFYRGIYYYKLINSNGKILETGKFQVNR